MKKIRLTERELTNIIKKVIKEEEDGVVKSGDVQNFINTITDDNGSWHIDRNTKTLYLTGKGFSYQMYCK